jgi:polyhydroxyalkanoate synthesis regulator phasin
MRKLMIAGAAVGVLVLAAVAIGGVVTSAQEGDGPIGTFLSKVAEKLGVGEDELKEAIKDARLEMIDEAVAEGRLTEEQADHLGERAEGDGFLFLRPRQGGPHPGRMGGLIVIVDAVADILDMDKEDLKEARQDGQSLVQIADVQGMSAEEFTEALLNQIQAQLDEFVSEGKLTEEQAERVFQGIESNIDRIASAEPGGRGAFLGGRGHPGFRGPWHGPFEDDPFGVEPSEVTG